MSEASSPPAPQARTEQRAVHRSGLGTQRVDTGR